MKTVMKKMFCLMLVAVLAVALLWDKMSVWLGETWDQIIGESGKIK